MNRHLALLTLVSLVSLTACSAPAAQPAGDTGIPIDVQPDATDAGFDGDNRVVCVNAAGHTCPDNAICPAENGCNWCQCADQNRDLAACTLVGCNDAGAGACQSQTDCAGGTCLFFQGCGTIVGRCVTAQILTHSMTLCGCDGVTFTSDYLDRPYSHAGACP